MASRDSIEVLPEMTSNDIEVIVMESSDSESESVATNNSNPDVEEKDFDSDSQENNNSEKVQVNIGPVLSLKCLHDDDDDEEEDEENADDPPPEKSDKIEKQPQASPVKITAVNGSSEVFHPQSSVPARNNWEGVHNFKIKVQCGDATKKSESTVFSEEQRKLYVVKDHPFKILVYAENVPKGSIIKVSAVFAMVEHAYEVVKRCPTHAQADYSKGNPAYEHFVQCFSDTAIYSKNKDNGKLSVSVPYEKPQEGENFTTYLFKLTCFNSCTGGINRRPFMLVFTLEKDNIPLGRQTIEAKVCACPVRDFKVNQEKVHRKKARKSLTTKTSSDEEAVKKTYTISVRDPELYAFLKQMKCLYEISAYSSKIKPDT